VILSCDVVYLTGVLLRISSFFNWVEIRYEWIILDLRSRSNTDLFILENRLFSALCRVGGRYLRSSKDGCRRMIVILETSFFLTILSLLRFI